MLAYYSGAKNTNNILTLQLMGRSQLMTYQLPVICHEVRQHRVKQWSGKQNVNKLLPNQVTNHYYNINYM